jgi:hypothetical protein
VRLFWKHFPAKIALMHTARAHVHLFIAHMQLREGNFLENRAFMQAGVPVLLPIHANLHQKDAHVQVRGGNFLKKYPYVQLINANMRLNSHFTRLDH